MQVDELQAALALAGRAMSDLAQVDNALLLVRGEIDESIAFDRTARPREVDRSHDWYRLALARLKRGASDSAMPAPCTMPVSVPSQHAMAVLTWYRPSTNRWPARPRRMPTNWAGATKPKPRCVPSL